MSVPSCDHIFVCESVHPIRVDVDERELGKEEVVAEAWSG